jgi:hypothetical protein
MRAVGDDHFVACHFPLAAPEAPPRADLLAAQHAADEARHDSV